MSVYARLEGKLIWNSSVNVRNTTNTLNLARVHKVDGLDLFDDRAQELDLASSQRRRAALLDL